MYYSFQLGVDVLKRTDFQAKKREAKAATGNNVQNTACGY